MKNNTKNGKFFSNYNVHNVTGVELMDNELEREHSVDGKIQRKKSYAEILKSHRNTACKLEETGTKVQLT